MEKNLPALANEQEILLLASKDIGLKIFSFLLAKGYKVNQCLVGSKEDSKLITLANDEGIPVEVCCNDIQKKMVSKGKRFKWLLNIWSPHILSQSFLSLADHRLNVHPALVPKCRGNDCAAWTIRNNYKPGVSLLEMDSGVDSGNVYVQNEIPPIVGECGLDLHLRLLLAAEELFKKSWENIYRGKIKPSEQKGKVTTYTRKQTNNDRQREGFEKMTLSEFCSWALAHNFSPKSTAEVSAHGKRFSLEIKIKEIS